MSFIAYRDEKRTEPITPEEALDIRDSASIREDYFCPNPYCDARLVPVSGDEQRFPFFRARKDSKHCSGCDYKSYEHNSNPVLEKNPKYKGLYSDDFSIDFFFNFIMEKETLSNSGANGDSYGRLKKIEKPEEEEAPKLQPITNLKKLYNHCISHDINDNLGSVAIKDLFLDERTIKNTYRVFIPNDKIMILDLPISSFGYSTDNSIFYFSNTVVVDEDNSKEYKFEIKVLLDRQTFSDLRNEVYNLKPTNARFILVTKVNKEYGDDLHYFCSLEKLEQCFICKKQ